MTVLYPTPALRWRATTTRDSAAHAAFVYAVLTTRIYCRPTCPARLARRANIAFYDDAAAAEGAGFRACKRCRPGEPNGQSGAGAPGEQAAGGGEAEEEGEMHAARRAAERARGVLERERGSVVWKDVAREVGRSPRYLHEAFKRAYGCTPGAFAAGLKGGAEDGGAEVGSSALQDAGRGVDESSSSGEGLDDFRFADAPLSSLGMVEFAAGEDAVGGGLEQQVAGELELDECWWENLILWEPVTFSLQGGGGHEQVSGC